MGDADAILRAVVERPGEADQTWLVLADWLDDRGRHAEAELIRLRSQPGWRPDLDPAGRHARMVELLRSGVRPCVPTRSNALGMRFVWCPPGLFRMGSPADEPERYSDEDPFPVTLTRGFWLGATAVTQEQWQAVTGENPSYFPGERRPVECVSWDDSEAFCRRLGQLDGGAYRLPTEAEWEYACRAGTQTPFFWGDTITTDLVNYDGKYIYGDGNRENPDGLYRHETVPVETFPPNIWGLYEMHGNLLEWCADWYAHYPADPQTDPTGPASGGSRSARGGSWFLYPRRCRSADRRGYAPAHREYTVGVRICLVR